MLLENELLQYIHKTAAMGCQGIECVMPYASKTPVEKVLQGQWLEYRKLEHTAKKILCDRGQAPTSLPSLAKLSARMMSDIKLMGNSSVSKIAEMTIQGNTMGVTKTLKHLHDYQGSDRTVRNLTRKLLATEESNVEQLKPYL